MKPSQPKPKRMHTVWSFLFMFIAVVLWVFGISSDNPIATLVLLPFSLMFLLAGLYAADKKK